MNSGAEDGLKYYPGFNTFEWSCSRACSSICQTVDLCWHTPCCKGMEVLEALGRKPLPPFSLWNNVLCCYITQSHQTWERHQLLEFAVGCPTKIDELLDMPRWKGITILYWDPIVLLLSWTCWNPLCLECATCITERGGRVRAPCLKVLCLFWPKCTVCRNMSDA